MTNELSELKFKADKIFISYQENGSELELDEEFFNLENQVNQLERYPFNQLEQQRYSAIKKILIQIRNDFDLYDEDAERNSMFPIGEDD